MPELTKDVLTLDTPLSIPPAAWHAERSALAVDTLRATGRLRLRVHGESMLPSLWPGDMVEIAPCSVEGVRPGEIVLAIRDGRFFLHRFLARSSSEIFLLRGDSMPAPDAAFPNEALLGRLVARVSENPLINGFANGVISQATEEVRFGAPQPLGIPERPGVPHPVGRPEPLGVPADLGTPAESRAPAELGVPKQLGVAQRFSAAISGPPAAAALAAEVQRPVLPPRPWSRPIGWLLCHIAPIRSLALSIHARRHPEHAVAHAPSRTTDLEAS